MADDIQFVNNNVIVLFPKKKVFKSANDKYSIISFESQCSTRQNCNFRTD